MSHGKSLLKGLEKRIKERKKLIKRFVDFAEKLVSKHGEELSMEVGDSNTNIVALLRNFGNFTFWTDTGQSMMGGNDVKIWYHPCLSKISLDRTKPVLSVWYQTSLDEERAKIYDFDKSMVWQSALNRLISCKDRVVAQAAKKREACEKKSCLEEENKIKRAKLEKEALKLKL